jgi:aspartyl-tRNA synthetase
MRTLSTEIINKEGEIVELMGFVKTRRDHGKIIFIDLKDRDGITQIVFSPQIGDFYKLADKLRQSWVIKVNGLVKIRPKGMENPSLLNGKYEVEAKNLEVISEAKALPIDINSDGYDINEEVRMKYRYLDLRRERLNLNLKTRAKIFKFIRDFLIELNFIEIETPILTKSTPEGARDYLVPSRLESGKFYALPQSPQQYKQLLMVAGFERYFQFARCFRDEDTRGDRQPEFTQLDLEMSFISQDEILNLIEEMFINLIKNFYPQKNILQVPFPRLTYQEAIEKYGTDKPDLRKNKNKDELAFCFVYDFPMFEWREEEKRFDAVHHPFTRPKTEDIEEIKKDPSKILAYQYDFVLNGYEVGGGSLRSYRPEILEAVFEIMGHTKEQIKEKFGHLLEAFSFGVPDHGGIAIGLDRIMMILQNEESIREVIAFPKTGDGRDLMMAAPAEVDKKQLKELGLEIKTKEKK